MFIPNSQNRGTHRLHPFILNKSDAARNTANESLLNNVVSSTKIQFTGSTKQIIL